MSSTKKICIENDTDQRVPTSVKNVQAEMSEDSASLKKGELTAALAQIVTLTAVLKSASERSVRIFDNHGNVDNQILDKLAKLQATADRMIKRLHKKNATASQSNFIFILHNNILNKKQTCEFFYNIHF